MAPARRDDRQLTLDGLAGSRTPTPAPGSLDFDRELRLALNRALKETPKDRFDVAAEMSRLTGEEISKTTIDSWTGASRTSWNMPAKHLPAFIQATGAHWLLDQIATKVGCKVLAGDEIVAAKMAQIDIELARLKDLRSNLMAAAKKAGRP